MKDVYVTMPPKDYDKLLARINYDLEGNPYDEYISTIRAVVELHTDVQKSPKNRGKSGLRARCTECGFAFPCPTIQIIEKELK